MTLPVSNRVWVVTQRGDMCLRNNIGESCPVGCLAAAIGSGQLDGSFFNLVSAEALTINPETAVVSCRGGGCNAVVKLEKI